MLIEAMKPMLVRLPDGDIHLSPGKPVDIPEEHALRLLERAHDRVRMIKAGGALAPGAMVEFNSPLFGRLAGEIVAVLPDSAVEIYHPLTERLCRIPRAWLAVDGD